MNGSETTMHTEDTPGPDWEEEIVGDTIYYQLDNPWYRTSSTVYTAMIIDTNLDHDHYLPGHYFRIMVLRSDGRSIRYELHPGSLKSFKLGVVFTMYCDLGYQYIGSTKTKNLKQF